MERVLINLPEFRRMVLFIQASKEHKNIKVRKIGNNTDLNFSIGIEPILKPLYLERR